MGRFRPNSVDLVISEDLVGGGSGKDLRRVDYTSGGEEYIEVEAHQEALSVSANETIVPSWLAICEQSPCRRQLLPCSLVAGEGILRISYVDFMLR